MNKNKKAALTSGSNKNLTNNMKQKNHTTTQNQFQYLCSFCWRELPDNGLRFAGFGVCPPHLKLAETIVDLLRGHAANYSNNLGVAK